MWREVFSPDELALAAGVPRHAVALLVRAGALQPVPGTSYFSAADALRAAAELRAAAVITTPAPTPHPMFSRAVPEGRAARPRLPMLAASGVHASLLLIALWLTSGRSESAPIVVREEPVRLVFLMSPGPGGGGGGSGRRQPAPARPVERRGRSAVSVPDVIQRPSLSRTIGRREPPAARPAPSEQPPEPLEARAVVAPVLVTASAAREQDGAPEPAPERSSAGAGTGGNAGTGRGEGAGRGVGAGLGDGAGGGTGGGPYRPGSGVEPPRLLQEVKASYSEEARQRGVRGEVILEVVVRRDGSVGDVRVQRGLGAGLDERAVAAVRQWRFAPARRQGEPVDVIVEVAVDFSLR